MGRETFLVPVKWEDDWPLASWETGLVENAYTLEGHVAKRNPEDKAAIEFPYEDDFNSEKLSDYWLGLRKMNPDYVTCKENSGSLRLYGGENFTGNDLGFVARRQTSFSYEAYTKVTLNFADENDAAGIVCFQNDKFYYKLQLKKTGKTVHIQLVKCGGEEEEVINEEVFGGNSTVITGILRVVAEKQKLRFEYGLNEANLNVIAKDIDASMLSVEKAGGFVGTVVGMFAVAGGDYKKRQFFADFDWFKYEDISKDWVLV